MLGIYDIFGNHSSTLQGADILAALTGFRVYIPDLFEGKPLPLDVIPPNTPEKSNALHNCEFFC